MNRREFVRNSGAAILVLAAPASLTAVAIKEVQVICATNWRGSTWIVFDDLPTTIFRFDQVDGFQPQAGDKLLAHINAHHRCGSKPLAPSI